MRQADFAHLRARVLEVSGKAITQSEVANAMGIAPRTVANWESCNDKTEFSPRDASSLRAILGPRLFCGPVRKMVEQAAECLPSEVVSLWLVDGSECICIEGTTYLHFRPNVEMQRAAVPLAVESLTTYPLRTGEFLNLQGDEIEKHPAKKYKGNRNNYLFKDGKCESLLHVPSLAPSPRGPQPVLMLSLENRFDEHGEVVRMGKDSMKRIYSQEDERVAHSLVHEFRDALLVDMRLLEMVS